MSRKIDTIPRLTKAELDDMIDELAGPELKNMLKLYAFTIEKKNKDIVLQVTAEEAASFGINLNQLTIDHGVQLNTATKLREHNLTPGTAVFELTRKNVKNTFISMYKAKLEGVKLYVQKMLRDKGLRDEIELVQREHDYLTVRENRALATAAKAPNAVARAAEVRQLYTERRARAMDKIHQLQDRLHNQGVNQLVQAAPEFIAFVFEGNANFGPQLIECQNVIDAAGVKSQVVSAQGDLREALRGQFLERLGYISTADIGRLIHTYIRVNRLAALHPSNAAVLARGGSVADPGYDARLFAADQHFASTIGRLVNGLQRKDRMITDPVTGQQRLEQSFIDLNDLSNKDVFTIKSRSYILDRNTANALNDAAAVLQANAALLTGADQATKQKFLADPKQVGSALANLADDALVYLTRMGFDLARIDQAVKTYLGYLINPYAKDNKQYVYTAEQQQQLLNVREAGSQQSKIINQASTSYKKCSSRDRSKLTRERAARKGKGKPRTRRA